jgi:hypothetical protein
MMATEKMEMDGCWDLDQIRERLYYFQKFIFVFFLKQKPLNLQIRKHSKFRISDKSFEVRFLRHQNTFV